MKATWQELAGLVRTATGARGGQGTTDPCWSWADPAPGIPFPAMDGARGGDAPWRRLEPAEERENMRGKGDGETEAGREDTGRLLLIFSGVPIAGVDRTTRQGTCWSSGGGVVVDAAGGVLDRGAGRGTGRSTAAAALRARGREGLRVLTVSGGAKARKKDSWGSGGGAGLDRHGNRGGILDRGGSR